MLQAKKRFWGKKPGFDTGDILHIGVNLIFAAMIYAMVIYWNLAFLAITLIVLSKWRVLAVQPRFWIPNIKANLVDIIVGVSTIALIDVAKHDYLAVMWILLYVVWLLFLKPKDNDVLVGFQAFWALALGSMATFMLPSIVDKPIVACAGLWLVGWSAARHFFSNYEEPHYRTLSMIWGVICAQYGWISLHWLQYYIFLNVKFAVYTVVIGIISVSLAGIYHAYKKQNLQRGVIIENAIFAGALLLVVFLTAGWSAKF